MQLLIGVTTVINLIEALQIIIVQDPQTIEVLHLQVEVVQQDPQITDHHLVEVRRAEAEAQEVIKNNTL